VRANRFRLQRDRWPRSDHSNGAERLEAAAIGLAHRAWHNTYILLGAGHS